MATDQSRPVLKQRVADLEKALYSLRADSARDKQTLCYFKSVLDNTNTPMFLKHADFTYIFINKQFARLAGIDFAQVAGKSDFDFFPKPIAEIFRSQDKEVLKQKQMLEFEETITLQNGDHTFITFKFPVCGKNGKINAIGGVCTDITNQKKTETELIEAGERYRSIFEYSPVGIFQIDIDGTITTCNAKTAEILNSSMDSLAGLNLLHSIKDERVKAAALLALSGRDVVYEGWYESVTGKYKGYLQGVFSPLYASDKSVIAVTCIFQDTTEYRETVEQLKQTQGQLEQQVAERTAELEKNTKKLVETNIALEVLLEKQQEGRKKLEKSFVQNIEKTIYPYLEKIRLAQNNRTRESLLKIVQANLEQITSPLTKNHDYLQKLTPAQMQVAELVKHGHTTKEIADLLNLSSSTIACHRLEIRKRLALTSRKKNLQAVLSSLT